MLPFGNVSAIFRLVFSVYCIVIKQGSRARGVKGKKHKYRTRKYLFSEHGSREGEATTALLMEGATQAPVIDYPIIIIEICLILAYKIR